MRLLRFIPIQLTLFLVIGILIGHYLNVESTAVLAATLLGITTLGLLLIRKKPKGTLAFPAVTALTTILMGMLAVSLTVPKNQPGHYAHFNTYKKKLWHLKVREVLKPNAFSIRYIADVKRMDSLQVSGKIIVSILTDSTAKSLEVDHEILTYGLLEPIRPPLNPHQFNYKQYLQDLGVYHQLQLADNQFTITKTTSTTLHGLAAKTRNLIIAKLKKAHFGIEELAIIQALLLGQRNDLSETTYTNYKDAGAVHILAVSGLHIGIILLLLQFLLRPLELLTHGRTLKLATILILLWAFAFLAGLSASVTRAVTMFSFVAYALYLNRPSNTFNILALSMFAILLIVNPKLLFQVGFQMSYAAVFSIVWIYPLLQKLWLPKNIMLQKIWQLLAVSFAAQVGVLPISLFYFHQFPGLFFVSNLLIVPALGLILGMGILVIVLSLFDFLPDFLVTIYDTFIFWMNATIAWVAQQESFIFKNISFDAIEMLLAYCTLVSLVWCLTKPTFKRMAGLGLSIIAFQAWSINTRYQTEKREVLIVVHQTRNSVLMHQKGKQLFVMAQDTQRTKTIATNYQIGEHLKSIEYRPLRNSYQWQNSQILIIDSLALHQPKGFRPDYVWLTQSPKLNLERLIDSLRPRFIIADGSNYKSYIARWKKTCIKRKLPFHYTGEKGAYFFKEKF
ncbi:ComEC/Rec2 family competence protein [uncultured Kriegella sp.]|uniref:ComEC/Rec2 family competence protein n=1 Tax=uncultured Kriegella sp. TaxID=1798910 RepID=UPI0030D780CF|tara:strand:- start:14047 stop:16074 length:2028 start_codon:yes stop_codon:yes gene_type:complete